MTRAIDSNLNVFEQDQEKVNVGRFLFDPLTTNKKGKRIESNTCIYTIINNFVKVCSKTYLN